MSDNRPNILFIMPDQQRGDCLGVDGHPVLLTPNMDALAGAGTRFRRGYSTCPSCIPARRSLLTGQFPATHGMPGFLDGVPLTAPTLPGELRRAGYQTALIGRTMHQYPPSARYGYDQTVLASGYTADGYQDMLRATTGQVDAFGSHGLPFNGWNARPWHLDETLHPTNHIVNEALRFLEQRDRTCPFFLTVSFYAPHPPLCPPAFYMDRYLRQELPAPTIGDWARPPTERQARGLSVESPRVELKGEALRSAQAGYFGLINHLDDQLFRLLGARGAAGFDRRNTIVVFTSDHGEMLGDHHYFRKCEPYEGSARIPFLLSGPGIRAGQVLDQPVCLEDLMPTLLDLVGLPVPAGVDGRSLAPLLRGEAATWRPWLHGEHAPCYSQEQANHFLTDGHHKYIWRPLDGSEQLFDLEADPGERRNLAAEAAHAPLVATWRQRLVEQLRGRPEGFTDGQRLLAGREYPGLLPHVRQLYQTR
jgi:arylsulfatase A-like enzyme